MQLKIGSYTDICISFQTNCSCLDYELQRQNLRFVGIQFDTPTFDRILKDQAAKPVDMLSNIGGTMGLLTGFSLISAVEIVYFGAKILLKYLYDQRKKNNKEFKHY